MKELSKSGRFIIWLIMDYSTSVTLHLPHIEGTFGGQIAQMKICFWLSDIEMICPDWMFFMGWLSTFWCMISIYGIKCGAVNEACHLYDVNHYNNAILMLSLLISQQTLITIWQGLYISLWCIVILVLDTDHRTQGVTKPSLCHAWLLWLLDWSGLILGGKVSMATGSLTRMYAPWAWSKRWSLGLSEIRQSLPIICVGQLMLGMLYTVMLAPDTETGHEWMAAEQLIPWCQTILSAVGYACR